MSLWATRQFPLRFDWKFFVKNILWMWFLGAILFFGKNTFAIIWYRKIWLLAILIIITVIYGGIFILMNFREGKLFFEQIKQMKNKWKNTVTAEKVFEDSVAG
jgi:hypothetical protein